jgi:MoaA/NifB/PqqE/SkfB family radical SAM enzyme
MSIAPIQLASAIACGARPQSQPIRRLPLVILYLSERCNSRCVSCDYWRHGAVDMNLAFVSTLLPELAILQTETVLISGGEPLLNPEWPQIAELLRSQGLKLWLITGQARCQG